MSRFLLILALAHILLVAIGPYATQRFRPGQWCSNNRRGECSLFTVGRFTQHHDLATWHYVTRRLRHELSEQDSG